MNQKFAMPSSHLSAIEAGRRKDGKFGHWHASEGPEPEVVPAEPAPGRLHYQDRQDAIDMEIGRLIGTDPNRVDVEAVAGVVLEQHSGFVQAGPQGDRLYVGGYRRRAGYGPDEIVAVIAAHTTPPADGEGDGVPYRQMSVDEFDDEFDPIDSPQGSVLWERHEVVEALTEGRIADEQVWVADDDEDGGDIYTPGMTAMQGYGYLVTAKPWPHTNMHVTGSAKDTGNDGDDAEEVRETGWEITAGWNGYGSVDAFPVYESFMDHIDADVYLDGVSGVVHAHNELANDGFEVTVAMGHPNASGPNEYALNVQVETSTGQLLVVSDPQPLAATTGKHPDHPVTAGESFRCVFDEMGVQRARFVAALTDWNPSLRR